MSELTHPGAVRLVARLEAAGLVEKGPGPDRRTAAVRLTSQGRTLARRARKTRNLVLGALIDGLTVPQQKALAATLDHALRARPRSRLEARRACRLCDHSVCQGDACPVGASAGGAQ